MIMKMRPGARPTGGRVLQGYFGVEKSPGQGNRDAMMQAGSAAKMRSAAVQRMAGPSARDVRRPGRVLLRPPAMMGSGAPRPGLLPGMGTAMLGGLRAPRMVAQARPNDGVLATPIPAGQLRVIGDGRPLEPRIRHTMEAFFQADFSGVRVHEGPAARAIGALAFTQGDELHFAPGLYDPTSRKGLALLGHELAHVIQQREGRVRNPYGHGLAIVQDPALEVEADLLGQQLAERAMSGLRTAAMPALRAARVAQPSSKDERDETIDNPGFWYTGERQAPPPTTRGTQDYALALETGKKRFITLSAGPQDTINPGVSQSTWTRYKTWYRSTFSDDGAVATVVTYFTACTDTGCRYENYFDTETGTITASHNVRSPEEKQQPDRLLGGSEIMFRQIIQVEDTTGRPFILRTLVRKSVINGPAQNLITYLRIKYGQKAFDVAYGSNDFLALLGTENGTAATYLVYDHGFYLGVRGITKARITEKGSIEFHFTPGPRGR